MGRLWEWVAVACALLAFAPAAAPAPASAATGATGPLPTEAPSSAAEPATGEAPIDAESTPAEVAAELPTPSCAEGPRRDGEVIVGTDCADTIVVPPNVAYVDGGPGNDTILATSAPSTSALACTTPPHCGVGSQEFVGGPGDDTVFGERGNDILRGGPGDDRLYGGIGDDLLEGGPGNDLLSGGFGADTIDGGEGSDFVRGDATIDTIVDTGTAPGDIDTLSYATGATPGFGNKPPYEDLPPYPEFRKEHPGFPAGAEGRGVYLDLRATTHGNGFDGGAPSGGGADDVVGSDFERIIGTPFADYIVGAKPGQQIYGGGGGDVLISGGAGTQLFGGADEDDCFGETATNDCEEKGSKGSTGRLEPTKVEAGEMVEGATDQAELYLVGPESGTVAEAITVTRAGIAPGETVTFTRTGGAEFAQPAAPCVLAPSGLEVTCTPGVPIDSVTVAGLDGADHLTATNLAETTSLVLLGGEGDDELVGGEFSDDTLVDGPGNDVLRGGPGDDGLVDGPGADQIFGEGGNDLLIATALCEGDTLDGGEGRDNASWAKLGTLPSGLGVDARLDQGVAGEIGPEDQVQCPPTGTPDTLAGIEDLEGSPRTDLLVGDTGPNQLLGHQGEDSYFAGAGEDSILANSESRDAVINCGADTDTAIVDLPATGDPPPIECEIVNGEPPGEYEEPPILPLPPAGEPTPPSTPAPETSAPPTGSTTSPGTTKPGGAKPGAPAKPKSDRTPPRTKLLGHPAKALRIAHGKLAAVTIRFGASERSHFECKLDARAFRPCRSPFHARLAAGRHTFRVYAIDAAGNRDRTPAFLRLRVVRGR
ncbi:MAG TPA: calcium-binding protein [Solirubrobacterales bacterium]